MRVIFSFMLLAILMTMEGCIFRAYPPYKPLSQSIRWEGDQGFFEYQIDRQTYLIGYSNYMPDHPFLTGDLRLRSVNRLIQGARQYALYRAAEFTKAQGEQFFAVLLKDDWYAIGYVPTRLSSGISRKYIKPRHLQVSPGAWVMIRIVDSSAVALAKEDNHVYSADTVLVKLAQENSGLAGYRGPVSLLNNTGQDISPIFPRWRVSSSAYDSVPVPATYYEGDIFGSDWILFKPGFEVTQTEPGRFTIAVWQERLISPMQMLWQCISHADHEGYKMFKLENWMAEEHLGGRYGDYGGMAWFRSSVDVVPLQKKDPASLEPVFVVEEIRSRLSAGGTPFP